MTTTYAYDALGQLVRVDDPHENATWVYEYDRGGNMTKRKKYAYTTGSLDGLSYSLRSYTYDSAWKDQLVSNGSYPLTYDVMGNLKTYADWEYEWEAGRLLKKQTQNSTVVSYDYDQKGMRIRKTVSHTNGYVYAVYNYTYNGTQLVHMTKNNDTLHFFYDNEGRPAYVNYNGDMYSYLYNLQGDVVAIVDSNSTIAVEYKYNAWGSILSRTGTMADTLGYSNPFRYRGYIYDDETFMYWLVSRYYYPELYKFINADILLDKVGVLLSQNATTYCQNNPIKLLDPTGFDAIGVDGDNAGKSPWCGPNSGSNIIVHKPSKKQIINGVAKTVTRSIIIGSAIAAIVGSGGSLAFFMLGASLSADIAGRFCEEDGLNYISGCLGGFASSFIQGAFGNVGGVIASAVAGECITYLVESYMGSNDSFKFTETAANTGASVVQHGISKIFEEAADPNSIAASLMPMTPKFGRAISTFFDTAFDVIANLVV